MDIDLEKQLVEKYPKLLRDYKTTPTSGLYYGMECEDGWVDLIDSALAYINRSLEEDEIETVYIGQIKQKFGTLRIYFYDAQPKDKNVFTQLMELEEQSENICEKCGSISDVNYSSTSEHQAGFIQVLCYGCLKANGRYKISNPRVV